MGSALQHAWLRRAALAMTAALAVAGCGTTVTGQSPQGDTAGGLASTTAGAGSTGGGLGGAATTPGGSAMVAGGAPGSATGGANGSVTTGGSQSGAGGSNGASTVHVPVTGGDRQGVTATTVKIGIVGIDPTGQEETNAAFGATTPPANTKDAATAIVNWANAHGGIAGRKIVPYYIERNTNSQDPNYDQSLCSQLTEDGKVRR